MTNMCTVALAVLVAFASTEPAHANDSFGNLTGQIDLGYRYYFEDGRYTGQSQSGFYPFAGFQLNGTFGVGSGDVVFQFSGLSDDENDRSILNIQKAYYTNRFDNWDLVLGYNVENWGVSNGRTIINVLNAKNRTNQVGNSDLIGTPMANVNVDTRVGTFSFYLLGDNVEGNFGGRATRQRGPFYTDDHLIRYEDSNSTDVALRFANSFSIGDGALDLGLSVFDGTNRESIRMPGCIQADRTVSVAACNQFNTDVLAAYQSGGTVIDAAADAGLASLTALTPYYQEIRQYGLTAVYVQGDAQLRFEGFHREAAGESFSAAIVGGDYAFHDILDGSGTLTVGLEYHYDGRSERHPVTVYEDDLFLGFNFRANDTNDSTVDFGVFYDLDEASQIYSLSMSRRFGDRTRVSINANHVNASSALDTLSSVDGSSFIEFSVSTFF